MASQVFSGTSNPSYTNNTGQNVRIVINFMLAQTLSPPTGGVAAAPTMGTSGNTGITLTWAGVSVNAPGALAMGRNLAYHMGGGDVSAGLNFSSNNMVPYESGAAQGSNGGLPTEIMLRNGETFSARCGIYNIVVIREDGA